MRTKRKSQAHIIDNSAIRIIHDLLPEYWTIREYKPDYGVDLSLELFEQKDNNGDIVFDTMGEHLFIQVKGKQHINFERKKIFERPNVEYNSAQTDILFTEIDVIKFQLDTVELKTVERMSYAIPVLLFIVDTEKSDIFFICLNDYIDKILIHKDREYHNKESKTLYIPKRNIITADRSTLIPLMFYAKRPKMFAFFNKVIYQLDTLNYNKNRLNELYSHFATILLRFDIWSLEGNWPILKTYHNYLNNLLLKGHPDFDMIHVNQNNDSQKNYDDDDEIWESPYSPNKLISNKEVMRLSMIHTLWQNMANLQQVYEETCREWYLPAYYNELLVSIEGN